VCTAQGGGSKLQTPIERLYSNGYYSYLGRVGVRVGVTPTPPLPHHTLKIKTINYKKYTHIHTSKQTSKYSLFPWSPDPNTHTYIRIRGAQRNPERAESGTERRERTHLAECLCVSVGAPLVVAIA